jgi:hypothetical protein
MRRVTLLVLLVILAIAPISIAQNTDEQDIDRLFLDLKQTLIKRSAPEGLLSPSLPISQRQQEAQKAVRPYVSIQFRYNVADLQRTSEKRAKLPLIMEWETARSTSRLTGTAQLEKVDDRWYFTNFDFMTFPWVIVVVMCSFGVAFAAVVQYLYWRSKKRRRTVAA